MIAIPSALVVAREIPSAHATVGGPDTGGGGSGGGVGEVGDWLQPMATSSTAKHRKPAERAATDFAKPIYMNQPFYRIRRAASAGCKFVTPRRDQNAAAVAKP